jgi:hypothetical protein
MIWSVVYTSHPSDTSTFLAYILFCFTFIPLFFVSQRIAERSEAGMVLWPMLDHRARKVRGPDEHVLLGTITHGVFFNRVNWIRGWINLLFSLSMVLRPISGAGVTECGVWENLSF